MTIKHFSIAAASALLAVGALTVTNSTFAQQTTGTDGLYVSAQGGAAIAPGFSGDNGSTDKTGYNFGGALGYQTGPFRAEGEVSYLKNSFDFGSGTEKIGAFRLMANGYYDFMTGTQFVPYVGAGIGYVRFNEEASAFGLTDSSHQSSFGYQGIAGIGYNVTPAVMVGLEYRYFGATESSYHNNLVNANLVYHIGNV